jgi:serine/threonine protein kinase, bacterial
MLLNNRYRAIQNLGSGGFGETFLAEDTQMPSHRRCVIKLLKPITTNPQIYQLVQERFQREAAILEELGGSNNQIPALYAYFQQDGQFYLVQEYIEGSTLTAKIRQQGFLSEIVVQQLLADILPILEYIHDRKIIHRDIKPDNIIMRNRDNKPVLIDFGAVRELMGTVINSQGSPTSSIVIGTPGYMPSEQAAGRPIYSSDLYSLGMTAIYLLTGKQPQELETNPQTGEIVWQEHVTHINPQFISLIDRAIAYHPRERFTSAREMLNMLVGAANTIVPTEYPNHDYSENSPANNPPNKSNITATEHLTPATKISDNRNNLLAGGLIAAGMVGGLVIAGIASTKLINPSPTALVATPSKTPVSEAITTSASNQTLQPNNPSSPADTTNSTQNNKNNLNIPNPSAIAQESNYSWTSQRAVIEADLSGKSALDLDIMRNSIFARRGRRFDTPGLQSYFNKQPWYNPRYSSQEFDQLNLLSELEMRNAMYIKEYQTRFNLLYFR